MLKYTAPIMLLCLSLLNDSTAATIRAVDRQNVSKQARFLDPDNDVHVRAFMDAPKEDRTDRDYYVGIHLLPPLGGAPMHGGMPGLHIDYAHEESLRAAAPIILHNYGLPSADDLYINATVDLLRMHRRIPTQMEIQHLYDSRLTPFTRNMNDFMRGIPHKDGPALIAEARILINTLPGEAKNIRTVAGSLDAQAVLSSIKQLLARQVTMLSTAADIGVYEDPEYDKLTHIINILYGGNEAFQDAASQTTPSMFAALNGLFDARSKAKYRLDNNFVMNRFDAEIQICTDQQLVPLIEILKLPGGHPASPQLASRVLGRMAPDINKKFISLLKHLPQVHAGALLDLLFKDKDTAAIWANVDGFKLGKEVEAQKKISVMYNLILALVNREASVERAKKINGPGSRGERDAVMEQLRQIVASAFAHGER